MSSSVSPRLLLEFRVLRAMDSGFRIKYSSGGVQDAAMFSCMKVRDILEDLALEGRKGYLLRESNNHMVFDGHTIVAGETYVFVERRTKEEEWMKKQSRMPSASALAKSLPQIIKYLGGEDPIYDIGRVSGIMPLPVAHEAFAHYAELFHSHVPTPTDWANVTKMLEMTEFFDSEKLRYTVFCEHLTSYLKAACPNLDFVFKSAVDSGKSNTEEVDILVMVNLHSAFGTSTQVAIAKVEIKNEVGFAGEPCVEAVKYYGDYVNETVRSEQVGHYTLDYKRWSYYSSCVPMLIVEQVGANIRVGGTICHDRPGYEPLTPYLHLFKYVQNLEHRNQVARAISAIPRTVQALADFYSRIWSEIGGHEDMKDDRDNSVTWPFYLRNERLKDPGLQVVKFSRRFDRTTLRQMFHGRDEQLLYLVKYSDGEKKVVKFCQTYGVEVHRKWQEAGLAPEFTVTELEGGWKVILMDVYSPDEGWMPVSHLDPAEPDNMMDGTALDAVAWNACKEAVLKAYEQVHGLYPNHVHGDLRKSNILYKPANGGVIFIDFDWAGLENDARYPPFLNPHILWARGVKSGGLMLSVHDAELLRLDLIRT